MKRAKVCLVNASIHGRESNSAEVLNACRKLLEPRCDIETVCLAQVPAMAELAAIFGASNGFLFACGTYWDSWGSVLQRFLEESSAWEGGEIWLGKPAAVAVSMNSVGGKAVLSTLQGVLNTLGLLIPPMCGMVYSLSNHLALQAGAASEQSDDFWRLSDLEIICHNLCQALYGESSWRSWPVNGADISKPWLLKGSIDDH